MKILRVVGTILLILLILVLLINVFTPAAYRIERSIEIDASPNKVYNIISKFSRFNEWSPWVYKDTAVKIDFAGIDGAVGSVYKWDGNKNVGEGMMQMFELLENKKVSYKMVFGEGKDTAIGYISLKPEQENRTEVIWGYTGQTSFMFRFFNLLMDKFMGNDFEIGLNKLKALAESAPTAKIQSLSFLGGEYLYYKKDEVPFQEIDVVLNEAFGIVEKEIQNYGKIPMGNVVGMYFVWNQEAGTTNMAGAIPITPIDEGEMIKQEKFNGIDIFVYPEHIATVIKGGLGNAGTYHDALENWTIENNREMIAPVLEIYEIGHRETQDTSNWKTRIIYLMK